MNTSNWCDLPQNFLSSLLYFLSPRSRCVFKATCKSWSEAEAAGLLLPVPARSPSSPRHSSPILIRTDLDSSSYSYECYHPMSSERFRMTLDKSCQENAEVLSSNFGWLLMSENRGFFFFFNPFTKQRIDYGYESWPCSDDSFSALCFTSPPSLDDRGPSELTLFKPEQPRERDDYTLTVYGCLRSMVFYDDLKEHRFSPHNSLIFHRHSYFFLIDNRVAVHCHMHDNDGFYEYMFIDPKTFEPGTKPRHSFLLEVDGKLLGIFDYQGIRVLWLDPIRWEWNPVGDEDLKDKILYVSYKGSFVQCDDTTKGVGNKIYFPAVVNGGGVYYSLDTRKYHTSSGELEEIEDYGNSMTWMTWKYHSPSYQVENIWDFCDLITRPNTDYIYDDELDEIDDVI